MVDYSLFSPISNRQLLCWDHWFCLKISNCQTMAGTNCLFFSHCQAFGLFYIISETLFKGEPRQKKSFNLHYRCSCKVNETINRPVCGSHWSHRAGHAWCVVHFAPDWGQICLFSSRIGQACATSSSNKQLLSPDLLKWPQISNSRPKKKYQLLIGENRL